MIRFRLLSQKFSIFDLMPVGAPCTVVTVLYLILTTKCLTPTRERAAEAASETKTRNFFCSFRLNKASPMVGFTVDRSGLLTAKHITLVCVQRGEEVHPYAGDFVLAADDVYDIC
jgi:hypothetical protein